MTLYDLNRSIVNGTPPHFVIFCGEEVEVQRIYIQKMANNMPIIYADTVRDAVQQINATKSALLNTQLKLYVVIDDAEFVESKKAWEKVPYIIGSNFLVLRFANIDKRRTFYNSLKDYIIEFEKLNTDVLSAHTDILSDTNKQKLIEICENDYGRLLLEIDKIRQYAQAKHLTYDDAFLELNDCNMFYKPVGDITFKLTDAVCGGYVESSLKYLEQAKEVNEPDLRIISILYTEFKQMLMVQGLGANKQNAAERTGINPYKIKHILNKLGGYSIAELQRALHIITDIEQRYKTGGIEQSVAVDTLIISIVG